MAKKAKVELTLEELQAKKSKRQRGWVRFCAILLAVVLTLGIYGMASKGGPNVVSVYPNIVRAQTQTVVQKQDGAQTDNSSASDSTTNNSTSAPSSSEGGEEGGILDTIMGLLGGLDLSGLVGSVDTDGMGITAANAIQTAKDSLLELIDRLESSISGKPTISHEAVEHDFDTSIPQGDETLRQMLADRLNAATAPGVGYTVSRMSAPDYDTYPVDVDAGESITNIGPQTQTVNKLLLLRGTNLDFVVGAFNGCNLDTNSGEVKPITYNVAKGKTAAEAVAAAKYDASYANYGLKPTALTADDIAVVDFDLLNCTYTFMLKDVDNPNRRADCGLNRFTDDYLVQPEVAARMQSATSVTEVANSPLKLTDLDTKYSNITVMAQFNPLTEQLESLTYIYTTYAKFTVRTNAVQVTGYTELMTMNEYTNFYY